MFQHQSLGIKVNIQVTKLVLLRQRPVSPRVPCTHRMSLVLKLSSCCRGLRSRGGCLSSPPSQALPKAAVFPGPGPGCPREGDGPVTGSCGCTRSAQNLGGTLSHACAPPFSTRTSHPHAAPLELGLAQRRPGRTQHRSLVSWWTAFPGDAPAGSGHAHDREAPLGSVQGGEEHFLLF